MKRWRFVSKHKHRVKMKALTGRSASSAAKRKSSKTRTEKAESHPKEAKRLERICGLVTRYKEFVEAQRRETEARTRRLAENLTSFWPSFQAARRAQAEQERNEAPKFNIFQILENKSLEKHHSRFLGDLLDPNGRHSQGQIFLRQFLAEIRLDNIKNDPRLETLQVTLELESKITGESRTDIIVRCSPLFLIVIENKIGAGEGQSPDGTWQLKKYRDWLDKQSGFEEKKLIFLTPDGRESASHKEDLRLSYISQIRPLVTSCLNEIRAPRVQHALQQYLEAIDDLRSVRR